MRTSVVDIDGATSEEALAEIAQIAENLGLVNDEYKSALLEREMEYPTGLALPNQDFGIAIPHANPEYVKEQSLLLSLPETAVEFSSMDDPEQVVDVRVILLLVVEEEDGYPEFLSSLVSMFQENSVATLVEEGRGPELLDRIIEECITE